VPAGRVGGQAALAAGLAQQPNQLGGVSRAASAGVGQPPAAPGLGPQDPTAGGAEGRQHPWGVLAQQRPQLVVGLGAVPDRVLLGAGQHGDARTSSESAGSGRWAARSVPKLLASTTASA
jgi:hypothetical protein